MRTSVLIADALAAAAMVAAPVSAGHGPFAAPPIDPSAPAHVAIDPRIAVARDGTATVVWSEFDQARSTGEDAGLVAVAATRRAGGAFSAPADLSGGGLDSTLPQVAVAPDGTAVAAWQQGTADEQMIRAAARSPGGRFSAPADLSAPGQFASEPHVAVARDGTSAVVWASRAGGTWTVQAATRSGGGAFSAPADLSAPGQSASTPRVALGPDGTATAVWTRLDGAMWIVQAATRPPGGGFSAAVDVSAPDQSASDPRIAVAADGTATVVWSRSSGRNWIVQAATRRPGGGFSTPVDLSAPGRSAATPRIAVAADGTATVVWRRSSGRNWIVQAATRPPGGGFSTPVDLSAPGRSALEPEVAVAPDGTAAVVWRRSDGANDIIQAATRRRGGRFSDPVDLSAPGRSASRPQVAVAPDGTVTVVWMRRTIRIVNGIWNWGVQASTRLAGRSFSAPVDLSS